ncbi:hypothetical protein [Flavobacterium sp. PL002]|uniref:hypothetical protein n=1 Tax=Flavobacterium sp. PL002 TaxID=1897058 RepID=UPI001787D1E9|nr:hypothetical protein [Flavobacterium sp. PL002]MBE0393897.1 hypothetical protein [Flavobacterium sp. PL002]
MKNFTNPYYLVDFNASICNFEIYINDLPAYVHSVGGIIASHYPINHFILESGEQKIKFKIFPLKGETTLKNDTFLKLKVHAYDAYTDNYENLIEVFNFETPDLSNPQLPLIEVEAEFTAQIPYKIMGWKNSEIIDGIDAVKIDLISFYKRIYEIAKSQNVSDLYSVLKTRFNEIDISMYTDNEDNIEGLSNMFSSINDGGFILKDFPELTKIEMYGGNRIVNLIRNDNNPILYYVNKTTNEEFSLPLFVHKKNDFIVIR